MNGMLLIFLLMAIGFGALSLLAWRFGVDSRPGFDDPRSPVPDLSA